MKKMIMNLFLLLLSITIMFSGCKEDKVSPLESNTTPPGAVSKVTVTNGPGTAVLTYIAPGDKDLLYIKAVYTLGTGKEMEVKASYYSNTLTLEGFADTKEHQVKLYAVNRSEVASDPIIVVVKPLENPIWAVYRSLKVLADFGGLKFLADNLTKADLAIELMTYSKGKYIPTSRNIYTAAVQIDQSVRGLDTTSQKFAITIRDRWLNYTDTLYTTLKPLYETTIPKSGYKAVLLPTDVGQQYASTGLSKMWDNDIINWPNISLTSTAILTPQWVTFDIGKLANLSRIVIWDYPEYLNAGRAYYYGGDIKDFEVYGSDNPPSDGSFNNWTLLGKFSSVKPSGSGYGIQTSEDYNFANVGISYSFTISAQKFRYLRIKSIKNWQGTSFMSISEVQVYGDPR
ncbi:MAG: DUF4959 domain-containing protein [Mucilaginibacter sp.]|uniref:DUF5000 domain-containing lipoprotein n=1 Tax=Mucilaginibacter sp. TaxID=1882438 RepID=UPI003262E99F